MPDRHVTDRDAPAYSFRTSLTEHIAATMRANRYRLWRSQDVNDAVWDNVASEAAAAVLTCLGIRAATREHTAQPSDESGNQGQ